ncbi:hypothetical protein ACNKHQ_17730 [Shigella flexneri]
MKTACIGTAEPFSHLPPKATVGQALEAALEKSKLHWQYREELWLAQRKRQKLKC